MDPHYFKCNFCMNFHKDKTFMEIHEKQCHYNPKNKQCGSCAFRYLSESKSKILEYKCKKKHKCQVFKDGKLCEDYYTANYPELRLRAHEIEYTPRDE